MCSQLTRDWRYIKYNSDRIHLRSSQSILSIYYPETHNKYTTPVLCKLNFEMDAIVQAILNRSKLEVTLIRITNATPTYTFPPIPNVPAEANKTPVPLSWQLNLGSLIPDHWALPCRQ
jgi:hypothetical protein